MADSIDPANVDTGDPDLAYFVKQFNESVRTTRDARRQAEIHRDYYDGKQWSDAEVSKLQDRGQPVITDNRIKDKIEYMLGMERQTRTDPKAFPRMPKDDPAADAATDALRYVADCNHFQQSKSRVFENMCVEGFGGCEVIVEDDAAYKARGAKGNKKVLQRYIRWDRLYADGHALAADYSDARYMGIVKWMDVEEASVKYKDLASQFDDWITGKSFGDPSETYSDIPHWFDRERKRVQILEHYYKAGDTWNRVVFTRVGIVEKIAESPYTDCETGKPDCPIILQSMYVDRQGNRYGIIKRYKDLQDEINKRRSKSLHLLSVNRVLAEKGAVEDVEQTRREVARPDGYVEYTPNMKFEVQSNADLAEGQFKLLQEATLALSGTGPNAALLGTTGDISGRAKQVDQQGGAIQLGITFDSLRYWQTRVQRATWCRIKQFWTHEQWVRVTDDENTKFMPLNSTYPPDHKDVLKGKAQPGAPLNVVADMDLDIIIDEAPDVVTVQQEQFQTLAELAKSGLPIPPAALIQASSLTAGIKKQVLDAMSGGQEDIPPQVQQAIQQKQEQIQQISQAQQQKAQEQQATEQELAAGKAQAQVDQANLKVQAADIKAQQAKLAADTAIAKAQEETNAANGNAARLKALLQAAQLTKEHADLALTNAKVAKMEKETEILGELPLASDKGNV